MVLLDDAVWIKFVFKLEFTEGLNEVGHLLLSHKVISHLVAHIVNWYFLSLLRVRNTFLKNNFYVAQIFILKLEVVFQEILERIDGAVLTDVKRYVLLVVFLHHFEVQLNHRQIQVEDYKEWVLLSLGYLLVIL